MRLSEIFKEAPDIEISQLSTDSRTVMKDSIFFCIKGLRYDGHHFVKEAVKNGATVVVYEDEIDRSQKAVYIRVKNVTESLNRIAAKFYQYPAKNMHTCIIGGCYGKSSVSSVMREILNHYEKTASIGYYGIQYDNRVLSIPATNLSIIDNQKQLSSFLQAGIKNCIIETDAQSLFYHKLDSVKPDLFIYTNTSRRSNNFRRMGFDYFNVMRKYFYSLDDNSTVLMNRDDEIFEETVSSLPGSFVTYGFDPESDYHISDAVISEKSSRFSIKHGDTISIISTNLIGYVNIYNVACALIALDLMGIPMEETKKYAGELHSLCGVMERIGNRNLIVDCAYHLDSVENILSHAVKVTPSRNKLIVLIGVSAGYDETRLRNHLELISRSADVLILTEDQTEEGNISQILNDASKLYSKKCLLIGERKTAIESGIDLMNENDTFLILGKGNEKFLYRNMGKEVYDGDSNVAKKYLNKIIKEKENETFEIY